MSGIRLSVFVQFLVVLTSATVAAQQQPQFTPILELVPPSGSNFFEVFTLGDTTGDGTQECALRYYNPGCCGTFGVRVVSSASGDLVWNVPGVFATAADAGDLDGDGKRDVVTATGVGLITGYSGATGAVILTHSALPGQYSLGGRLSSAGDVNGDGYGDVLARGQTASGTSFVVLLRGGPAQAGLTGTVIQTFTQPATPAMDYGNQIGGLGDLNGDGFGEFYISATGGNGCISGTQDNTSARYYVVDGATLVPSIRYLGVCAAGGLGPEVVTVAQVLPDLNGDGKRELALGILRTGGGGAGFQASVKVFSGSALSTGTYPAALYTTPAVNGQMVRGIASIGDLTGGGVPEFAALSGDGLPATNDFTRVYNGANGALVSTIPGMVSTYGQLAGPGDVNGDGAPDLIAPFNNGIAGGAPKVCSGAATWYPTDSQTPLGAGCNPLGGSAPTLTLSAAKVGTTVTSTMTWPAPFNQGMLFASFGGASPTSLGSGCTVYLDFATVMQAGPVVFQNPGTPAPASFYIPLNWALVGDQFSIQGVALVGGGSFALTNALSFIIGF